MTTSAVFPQARSQQGMYESFYLRAVAPQEPLGVWIRHTVQKPAGRAPRGSLWCTVFDAARGAPFMHKLTSDRLTVPPSGWIEVGEPRDEREGGSASDERGEREGGLASVQRDKREGDTTSNVDRGEREGGAMGPGRAHGRCGAAEWSLRFGSQEHELRHLPREWLYRTRLPRTKLTSPAPAASFDGSLRLAGGREIELQGWRGMVGHNWGAEHAERWIWLHGIGFDGAPEAWLDVALGRLKIAGRLTPWVANGALSIGGQRTRIGGLGARGLRVEESAGGCTLRLPGEHGLVVEARASVPAGTAAGWHYGDPDGGAGHDVVNCSIAALELNVTSPGAPGRALRSAHGAVYELGMRERDHGVPIAPFSDD
jgi:hypothetical protein